MKKSNLVTLYQAKKLKELGFKEKVCHYQMSDLSIGVSYPRDWNNEAVPYGVDNIVNYPYLSVPTLDEALDWLLNKLDKEYNILIWRNKTISITIYDIYGRDVYHINSRNCYSNVDYIANLNVEKRSIISQLIKIVKNEKI